MKILFFIGSLNGIGGVERATINLLNGLAEIENINVTLVTFDYFLNPHFDLNKDIEIISLNIFNYRIQYIQIFFKINKILKNNIDIFLTVETMSLLFTFLPWLLNRKKTKLVVWEHFNFRNNNGKKSRDFFRVLAAKYADLIVLLTKRDAEEWHSKINVSAKITYIYNINQFNFNENLYNLTSKNIISVGRYTKVKGFDRLIKIWALFQKKYNCPQWNLSIVGYGEEKEKLETIISELGTPNVSLIATDNVVDVYKNSSFFCMSSYFEGLPMVLMEAQGFGLPAISFDIFTGPAEILINQSGIIINDGDLTQYADAIYKLISNQSLRMQMSAEAFEASKRFSKDSVISKWIIELEALKLIN